MSADGSWAERRGNGRSFFPRRFAELWSVYDALTLQQKERADLGSLEGAIKETEMQSGFRRCVDCLHAGGRGHPLCGRCGQFWELALARREEIRVKMLEDILHGAPEPSDAELAR